MKFSVLLLALLLLPCACLGETLPDAIDRTVAQLDLTGLDQTFAEDASFTSAGGLRETVRQLAKGEITLSFDEVLARLSGSFFSAVKGSLWRLTRLMAPALVWSVMRHLGGRHAGAGKAACSLLVCVFLARDLADHMALCRGSVQRMAQGMQGLFPVLLTLMTALGGSAGSAMMQPAVVAATGSITGLIEHVTLPLATAAAMLTMLCHLGEGVRVKRLAGLMQRLASWTLGVSFTAFLGVLATRGLTAAAVDGITIRTAKYALDNFVPVVGGLFADTVDTLVGAGLLVQSALGVTGLLILCAYAMAPLCQTLAAALLYRLAAALMEPVADGELAACIHDFAQVLMLLFIIQLCAAAMFVLLVGQVVAVSSITVMLR